MEAPLRLPYKAAFDTHVSAVSCDAGDETSIHVYTSCGQRLLQVGNDAVVGAGAACVSFGSSGLSIELGLGLINVLVSHLQYALKSSTQHHEA